MKKKVFVITPVLNEAGNLPELIKGWREIALHPDYDFEFVLIDDGSTDETSEAATRLAKGLNFHLIRHEINKGPGMAFASGFSFLHGKISDNEIVVTIEGDNTSRTDTLFLLLGRIVRENADVAFASPYAYGGGFQNTNSFRILLSHGASFMTKVFLNIHGIHTFTSFFRAYKGEVISNLQKKYGPGILECPGFECMVELLKKITLHCYSISEVPMKLDTSKRVGKSKMKVFKTVRGYFKVFMISGKWK